MAKRSAKKDKKKRQKVSARRRVEEHKSGFESTCLQLPEGIGFYNPKSGSRRVEILPYLVKRNDFADEGTMHYERTYWCHRGVGPNNDSYVCLAKELNKKCPICDFRQRLTKDEDADEDLIKDLAPKERQLYAILDHKEEDKGIQIWDVSWFLFGKKLDSKIKNADEDDDYEYFADPVDGMTVRIGFEDASFAGHSFVQAGDVEFRRRKSPIDDDVLEAVPCLDDLLIVKDHDELKALFLQTEDEEDEQEPKSKKKKSKKKTSKKDEEDEEDDEEDDDEADESEDEEFEDDETETPWDEEDEDDNEGDADEDEDEDEEEEDEEDEDEEDEDEEDEDAVEEADIKKMKRGELEELIDDQELRINIKRYKKVADLRKAVIKKMF